PEAPAPRTTHAVHVRNLTTPNAPILVAGQLTLATVVPPRAEEQLAPAPEATAEAAEPELIRKPREHEEGEPAEGEREAKPAKAEKAEKAEKPKGGKES